MEREEGLLVIQKKTVCDGEACRGALVLQPGRAALPLTGSAGNTLTHEKATKKTCSLSHTLRCMQSCVSGM